MNGLWLFLFLGKWSMVEGWVELVKAVSKKPPPDPMAGIVLSETRSDLKLYPVLSRRSTPLY